MFFSVPNDCAIVRCLPSALLGRPHALESVASLLGMLAACEVALGMIMKFVPTGSRTPGEGFEGLQALVREGKLKTYASHLRNFFPILKPSNNLCCSPCLRRVHSSHLGSHT